MKDAPYAGFRLHTRALKMLSPGEGMVNLYIVSSFEL